MMRDIRMAMKDMMGATSVTTYGAAVLAAVATLVF